MNDLVDLVKVPVAGHVPSFLPAGHPKDTPVPALFEAKLPDYFEVDGVRVFDEV